MPTLRPSATIQRSSTEKKAARSARFQARAILFRCDEYHVHPCELYFSFFFFDDQCIRDKVSNPLAAVTNDDIFYMLGWSVCRWQRSAVLDC